MHSKSSPSFFKAVPFGGYGHRVVEMNPVPETPSSPDLDDSGEGARESLVKTRDACGVSGGGRVDVRSGGRGPGQSGDPAPRGGRAARRSGDQAESRRDVGRLGEHTAGSIAPAGSAPASANVVAAAAASTPRRAAPACPTLRRDDGTELRLPSMLHLAFDTWRPVRVVANSQNSRDEGTASDSGSHHPIGMTLRATSAGPAETSSADARRRRARPALSVPRTSVR